MLLSLVLFMIGTAELPPPMPSSFYGTINAPAGTLVTASVGIDKYTTRVITWNGQTVYALNVGGYQTEGAKIIFTVSGKVAGIAYWHSGTNTNLNLVVPNPVKRKK
jgi:hypothetical protein